MSPFLSTIIIVIVFDLIKVWHTTSRGSITWATISRRRSRYCVTFVHISIFDIHIRMGVNRYLKSYFLCIVIKILNSINVRKNKKIFGELSFLVFLPIFANEYSYTKHNVMYAYRSVRIINMLFLTLFHGRWRFMYAGQVPSASFSSRWPACHWPIHADSYHPRTSSFRPKDIILDDSPSENSTQSLSCIVSIMRCETMSMTLPVSFL